MKKAIAELDAYIRWYKETRIRMSLSGRSPIDYRQDLNIVVSKLFRGSAASSGSKSNGH